MHNFRELAIWQKSRILVKEVYQLTKQFPKEEVFALTSQVRRCVVSIASNIAEGCGRGTNPQLLHFLNISQGSACELETQIILAFDLGYVSKGKLDTTIAKINEVQRMIVGFKKTIKTR